MNTLSKRRRHEHVRSSHVREKSPELLEEAYLLSSYCVLGNCFWSNGGDIKGDGLRTSTSEGARAREGCLLIFSTMAKLCGLAVKPGRPCRPRCLLGTWYFRIRR
jgi:hypothetical protein